jgi:hypothetical protein
MLAAIDPVYVVSPLIRRDRSIQSVQEIYSGEHEEGQVHPVAFKASIMVWEQRFKTSEPVFEVAGLEFI